MKTGKSIVELATEIARQQAAKADYIAPTARLQMDEKGRLQLGSDPFEVNNLPHQQIAEYTGIPKAYYDQMRETKPALLAENVNQWLADKNEQRMIRTLDGKVRAFLSDRYRTIENSDLAECVLPVLAERNLSIVSCEITDRRLYIKAFDKGIEAEIRRMGTDPAHTFLTDVVFGAICISNSEVGFGALNVAAGLYTGGCTNFAAFNDSRMRKYHVGGKALDSESIQELLSDETKKLTDAALWAQTRDVVASAFDRIHFDKLVARVAETVNHKIVSNDIVKVVDVAGEQFGFNKGERGSVLRHLIEGGDLSQYGLFNAVTRAAQDLPEYERASEFERVGGRIIQLAANDWNRIAVAA